MTMLGGVLPRDEIATPGESFTGEFRSAGREQHSAIRSALAQPLPGGKQVVCCIVSKAEADQRTLGPHEACALDESQKDAAGSGALLLSQSSHRRADQLTTAPGVER
jgi:hypothetical protein